MVDIDPKTGAPITSDSTPNSDFTHVSSDPLSSDPASSEANPPNKETLFIPTVSVVQSSPVNAKPPSVPTELFEDSDSNEPLELKQELHRETNPHPSELNHSKLKKIAHVLTHGMDSQQQEKALEAIKSILGW